MPFKDEPAEGGFSLFEQAASLVGSLLRTHTIICGPFGEYILDKDIKGECPVVFLKYIIAVPFRPNVIRDEVFHRRRSATR